MQKVMMLVLLALVCCSPLAAADKDDVQKRVDSYVDAINRNDPDAIAEHWLTDAKYTNPLTQESVQGREAIKNQFKEIFEQLDDKTSVKIETTSIDFPSPDKAIERGKALLTVPGSPQQESRFQVNLVKQDNKWYISSIDEVEWLAPTSHHDDLKDLEWLIGEWLDDDKEDNVEVLSTYQWDENKNFITHHFQVTALGNKDSEGKQVIGWDPVNNRIRSWLFDSDGGFAEANWKKDGNRWVIESVNTLPDGRLGSQTTILTPIDRNNYNMEITGRDIDGEILPNLGPVKIGRKGG